MSPNIFNKSWRGSILAYAPLILWVGVILFLGSGAGSMAQTSRFIGPLIEFFFPSAAPDTFLIAHAFIRKAAHFFEYAILAILAARAFTRFNSVFASRNWLLLTFLLVIAVATIDEFNQSFQSTRTSSGWDVLLDVVGGVTALAAVYLFRRRAGSRSGA